MRKHTQTLRKRCANIAQIRLHSVYAIRVGGPIAPPHELRKRVYATFTLRLRMFALRLRIVYACKLVSVNQMEKGSM
jgi:hypothetical protein